MNTTVYFRLCALLACSNFSEKELIEFADAVVQEGGRRFAKDVVRIKTTLDSSHRVGYATYREIPPPNRINGVGEKVERLLLEEAGLSKAVAVRLLTDELKSRFPRVAIPPESRKGFRQWIRRLSTMATESDLLHLATTIRNKFVHEKPADWRLK